MINLVMIGPYPQNPAKIQRGVEAVTVYLVDGLKSIPNLRLQIISCTSTVDKEVKRVINGITVHFVPSTRRFGNITFGTFDRFRIRRKIIELSPDIIHNQYHFAYPYIESKPICPAITSIHGITYKEAPYENERLDWLRRLPRVYLERVALKRVEHAICVTEYVRQSVAHMTKANLYVVENPVSSSYFKVERQEIPNTVLFVGTLIRRKNLLDLLKAVNLLKDRVRLNLRIIGVKEENYYFDLLQGYIRTNRLEKHVTFLGSLNEEDVLKEYGRCSLLALTSYEESAGMVLEQAMAAGVPVVATRVGGVPCIVKDQEVGFLVQLGDTQDLADKIYSLLQAKDLRNKFSESGKTEAVKRFSPAVIAEATHNIYQKVLSL
jgi:glycosyltransferase involved in cell wall biosynthesis